MRFLRFAAKAVPLRTISITKARASSLGRMSDVCVEVDAAKEGSSIEDVPMASAAASMVAGDMIVTGLLSETSSNRRSFLGNHPGGSIGLASRKVKDIMLTGSLVPLLRSGTALKNAIAFITEKKIGMAGIIDSRRRLIGVMTDGDIRRFLLKYDAFSNFTVDDVMNKDPKDIDAEKSLKEALQLMESHKITSLFVKRASRAVGLIHIHDIVEQDILAIR